MFLKFMLLLINVMPVPSEPVKYTNCNVFKKIIKPRSECVYNVPHQIIRHGYPSETHKVTTDDGYILEIHRIPGSKSSKRGGQPVFLQHGFIGSSEDFIINGNNSLGFLLADQGYDVWLGNARGNMYSKSHVSIPVNSSRFWNFSWHEMGTHDLPAVLNYIGTITQKPQEIVYIGHSMGTTMFFVFSSIFPQAAKRVKLMIALAPVAIITDLTGPLKYLVPFAPKYQWLARHLGLNQFLPYNNKLIQFLNYACGLFQINRDICEFLFFSVFKYNRKQFNHQTFPTYLKNYPGGTSTNTLIHFAQLIQQGNFQWFDHGTSGNKIAYSSSVPPKYNISAIKIPVYMMYGESDLFTSYVDLQQLSANIRSLVGLYKVKLKSFTHVDFIFGKDAEELVYRPLLKVMRNFADN